MAHEGKKGSLVLALGLGKPKGGSKEPPVSAPEDEDEAPDGKRAAMQEFMDALKSADIDSAMEALESFNSMCGGRED